MQMFSKLRFPTELEVTELTFILMNFQDKPLHVLCLSKLHWDALFQHGFYTECHITL